jgi:hypothetical protein
MTDRDVHARAHRCRHCGEQILESGRFVCTDCRRARSAARSRRYRARHNPPESAARKRFKTMWPIWKMRAQRNRTIWKLFEEMGRPGDFESFRACITGSPMPTAPRYFTMPEGERRRMVQSMWVEYHLETSSPDPTVKRH